MTDLVLPEGITTSSSPIPAVNVDTAAAHGKVYLNGAHVAEWTPAGAAPVLWMSEKSFQRLPKDLQEVILKAGKEATKFHRDTETKDDADALKEMESKGMIKLVPFDTTEMQRLAAPVLMDYARELGAEDIMKAVQAVK